MTVGDSHPKQKGAKRIELKDCSNCGIALIGYSLGSKECFHIRASKTVSRSCFQKLRYSRKKTMELVEAPYSVSEHMTVEACVKFVFVNQLEFEQYQREAFQSK